MATDQEEAREQIETEEAREPVEATEQTADQEPTMPHEIDANAERFLGKQEEFEIDKLFRALVRLEGSDLHLKAGVPPHVRVNGSLRPLNRPPIDDEEIVRLIFPMNKMDQRRQRIFDEDGGCDFAYSLEVDGKPWRFRVNVLQQMGHVGLVARRVNNWIPHFEQLPLPPRR